LHGRPGYHGGTASQVHVVANTLDLRGISEISGTNGFSDEVKVLVARDEFDLLLDHDVFELGSDLTHLPE
jgi:hypothetical protein